MFGPFLQSHQISYIPIYDKDKPIWDVRGTIIYLIGLNSHSFNAGFLKI